jgi:hypothetical protein
MNDLFYVGIVVAFFIASGLYVRFCEKLRGIMESIIIGLIALALFAYLLFAILYP